MSDFINIKNDTNYDDLKIRMEENIKMLKEQIFQLFELSFKNKNDILKFEETITTLNKINNDLSKLTLDIEQYKKITNERIEKIFKLLMIHIPNLSKND
jgi:leucyl-tRNA synthetase